MTSPLFAWQARAEDRGFRLLPDGTWLTPNGEKRSGRWVEQIVSDPPPFEDLMHDYAVGAA